MSEPAPEPAPPGFVVALGFFLATLANSVGLDRVLALVAPRAARSLQLSVVFAGKIVRVKPLLGAPGLRVYSYGFLGQEALADLGLVAIAALAFVFVRRSLARPFALDRATLVLMAKVGGVLAAVFATAALVAGLIAARVEDGAALRLFLDRLDMAVLTHPLGLFLALGGFLFAAPLAEELVFRGLVYRSLRARLDPKVATILQAALFACCHFETGLDPLLIAIPYLWGIGAAVLFERTRSLAAAVLLHAAGNAAGLLVIAAAMGSPGTLYAAFGGRC